MTIFTEPHAYISPKSYMKNETVPTWNYVAIHIYGRVRILSNEQEIAEVMKETMIKYEPEYYEKWLTLPDDFKKNLLKGIVAFRIDVTDVQGKIKLSQNKNQQEIENIIERLSKSELPGDELTAEYMKKYSRK